MGKFWQYAVVFMSFASLNAIEPEVDPFAGENYSGQVEVSLEETKEGISAEIKTDRLFIRSITAEDTEAYVSLFEDEETVRSYASGKPKTREETERRLRKSWLARWHAKDPFSALAITRIEPDKDPKDYEFIGHVIVGHGYYSGAAQLAFILKKEYWNQGYGKEAVTSVVRYYAKELAALGYKTAGKPLKVIEATAKTDNEAGIKILEYCGMKCSSGKFIWDGLRLNYSIDVDRL